MATTLGIQDSFSTPDHETGSPPSRSPMSRYIPGDMCPLLPPTWHLGWVDFGWMVRVLPGGTDGRGNSDGNESKCAGWKRKRAWQSQAGSQCFLSVSGEWSLKELRWHFGVSQVAVVVKNPPANAGDIRDMDSMLGLGRSPGGVHGNPLQYSCLENPMDRGGWGATVHGGAESDTTEAT